MMEAATFDLGYCIDMLKTVFPSDVSIALIIQTFAGTTNIYRKFIGIRKGDTWYKMTIYEAPCGPDRGYDPEIGQSFVDKLREVFVEFGRKEGWV